MFKVVKKSNLCSGNQDNSFTTEKMNIDKIKNNIRFKIKNNLEIKVCKKCGFICDNIITLNEHKKIHFHCDICDKNFTCNRNLRQHFRRHHNDNIKYSSCVICNKVMKFDYLGTHVKKVHAKNNDSSLVNCDICNKTFRNHEALKIHHKNHIDYKMACHLCNKNFKNKFRLNMHLNKTHSNELNVCPVCGKAVKNIHGHMKRVHTEHDVVTCDVCGKSYGSIENLKSHKRHTHDIVSRDYVCEVCGASFKLKDLLKNHLVIHSEERNYKCDICDKTFKLPSVLNTHKRVHSDIEPYSCVKCNERFKWKGTYDKHLTKCLVNISPLV